MQMEAEYSDLFDRKLISLYGMKGGKATHMDTAGPMAQQIICQNQMQAHQDASKKDQGASVSMSQDKFENIRT